VRYGEAERGREGMGELCDGPVDEGVKGRELRANNREARSKLPDSDVDVAEADLAEDGALDVVGSGLGILEGDSLGLHADGYKDLAERILSPTLAQPKPMMAVNVCPCSLRYASMFLTIPTQEDMMRWPWVGRSSRMYGRAAGPPWRFGQAGPVLYTKGAPLIVP